MGVCFALCSMNSVWALDTEGPIFPQEGFLESFASKCCKLYEYIAYAREGETDRFGEEKNGQKISNHAQQWALIYTNAMCA